MMKPESFSSGLARGTGQLAFLPTMLTLIDYGTIQRSRIMSIIIMFIIAEELMKGALIIEIVGMFPAIVIIMNRNHGLGRAMADCLERFRQNSAKFRLSNNALVHILCCCGRSTHRRSLPLRARGYLHDKVRVWCCGMISKKITATTAVEWLLIGFVKSVCHNNGYDN